MAGAPKGNKNSSLENRLWADTIRRAATQDPKKLRKIADNLLTLAEGGDIQAMREIGDRLDGKPHQTIAAEVDSNVTVEILRYADPKAAR